MTPLPVRAVLVAATLLFLSSSVQAQVLLTENFDLVIGGVPFPTPGWVTTNNSATPFDTFLQGVPSIFSSHSGAADSYIAGYWGSTFGLDGPETISNWLITPTIPAIRNGVQIRFWTRTVDAPAFADRLEVRLSTNGTSSDVGSTPTSVGDFTTLMGTINPNLNPTDYPSTWTEFTYTVSGVDTPTDGRFAFRYFVTDGGFNGMNSDFIGIDTLTVEVPVPEPTGLIAVVLTVPALIGVVRRVRNSRRA